MSISREELVNILSVVSFLAHADRDVQVSEKKVLIATLRQLQSLQKNSNK